MTFAPRQQGPRGPDPYCLGFRSRKSRDLLRLPLWHGLFPRQVIGKGRLHRSIPRFVPLGSSSVRHMVRRRGVFRRRIRKGRIREGSSRSLCPPWEIGQVDPRPPARIERFQERLASRWRCGKNRLRGRKEKISGTARVAPRIRSWPKICKDSLDGSGVSPHPDIQSGVRESGCPAKWGTWGVV